VSVTISESAEVVTQYVWHDNDGLHISQTGDQDVSGLNMLLTASKMALRSSSTELATFSSNLIELGKNAIDSVIRMCGGKLSMSYVKGLASQISSTEGILVSSPSSVRIQAGSLVGGLSPVMGVSDVSGWAFANAEKVSLANVDTTSSGTWATTDVIRAINHGISTSGKRTWPSRTLWTGYAADGSSINVPGIGDWLIVGVGMQLGLSETNNGVVETIAMIPVVGTSYVGGTGGMSSGSDERQVFVSFSRSGTSLTVRRASMVQRGDSGDTTYSRHVLAVYGIL